MQPLKESDGQYICYSYGEPGHTSRCCSQSEAAKVSDRLRCPIGTAETNIINIAASISQPGPSMIRSHTAESTEGVTEALNRGAFWDCLTIEVSIAGVKTNLFVAYRFRSVHYHRVTL